MSPKRVTRRQILQSGSLLALPAVWHGTRPPAAHAAPAAATGLRVGSRMYESIGVRPIINGRGTYTILSGSLMLPEVRAAMDEAAQHYVHLDELAEGIGARLAEELREFDARRRTGQPELNLAPVDEELHRKLEALGYIGS